MTHILGVLLNRFFFKQGNDVYHKKRSYKTSRKSTLLNKGTASNTFLCVLVNKTVSLIAA